MKLRSQALGLLVLCGLAASAFAKDGDCRVIVAFKGTADAKLCADRGMDVEDAEGRLVVGRLSAARIAKLRAEASVAYVEEDGIAYASADAAPTGVVEVWGGSQPSVSGAGVKVAIIDTGIDLKHPDLAANIGDRASFVRGAKTANDDNGHGSHVAGVVAAAQNGSGVVGVAPGATLLAAKVLDRQGSGYISEIVKGVNWAVSKGAKVANMSLGSSSSSTTLANACASANAAGVLLVAAAGNSGPNQTSYPAAYDVVVAVGAVDAANGDAVAYFSNTGSYLDVAAPGVAVYSTYKSGGYATLSGTSMASPHAAGVAALIFSEPTSTPWTNAGVRAALEARARDVNGGGWDSAYGWGVVLR
jgi:subtilisin